MQEHVTRQAVRGARTDSRQQAPPRLPAPHPVPLVSVVIPVRNERAFIACCLDSVLASDYPGDRLEILVVDGLSDDGTREILAAYASRFGAIRMLDNPKQITPAALNLGIREARGEWIVRLDAHARIAPDYISTCVARSASSGADNVGGRMRTLPRGRGVIGEAIAAALSHPFGVGNSAFRTGAEQPRWVDTVFGGCYRRDVFRRVGEFNERLARGQDLEFHLRLKRSGGRTLLVPAARCDYFARCDPGAFLKHAWTNGVWAIRPFLESDIVPIRPRHLAPLAFVLALVTGLAVWFLPLGLGPFEAARPWPFLLLALCYLAAALVSAAQLAWRRRDARLGLLLPGVFLSLHLSYGLGSWWEIFGITTGIVRRAAGRRREIRKG
jgi:glycosyltransferase involved in cell wall biosynthesis